MKNISYLLVTFLTLTGLIHGASAQQLSLAKNGISTYVIALAADAVPAEETAAQQFQTYFSQVTGIALPIKAANEVKIETNQILIGTGDRVKVLLPQQDWKALGQDGIVIKTIDNKLILAGGRPRGSLYAVYQFLENQMGCRWWTATESHIPYQDTIKIDPLNIAYTPPFAYRQHSSNASYGQITIAGRFDARTNANAEYTAILHENGNRPDQSAAWGGNYKILGWVHTFSKLLPPAKYFKEHPEWYSDPNNGFKPCTVKSKMPAPQRTQLCMTNPQVVDELTKQAMAWIKENPQAGYISISQNDNADGYCHCPDCLKLIEQEESAAGPLIQFVNEVAGRIHQQYPDFLVSTLAYHYSEKPPKTIRPADNVIVRLTSTDRNFGYPLNSVQNAEDRDTLLAWKKIAPRLFLWNYFTDFHHTMMPYPNLQPLQNDMRFYAANHVKGIFFQGNARTNGNADFSPLRDWLLGKLMWNPQLDQEKLTAEFMAGYYGDAAPYLQQYLNLIHQAFVKNEQFLSPYNQNFTFLTLDVMNQATQLFDKAAAAVKQNPELGRRVQSERLSLELAWLWQYKAYRRIAQSQHKPFLGPQDPKQAVEEFYSSAHSLNTYQYRLKVPIRRLANQLRAFHSTNMDQEMTLPTGLNVVPEAVINIQQNEFVNASLIPLSAVKDAAASDGYAYRIDASQTAGRPLRVYLSPHGITLGDHQWQVYAVVRAETKPGKTFSGGAAEGGLFNVYSLSSPVLQKVSMETLNDGAYHLVKMGSFDASMTNDYMNYLYMSVPENPNLQAVYVDRLLLVR